MPDSLRDRFGARVRRERIARGWTQETLADRANLHVTFLSGIENGERNPSLETLGKLATGFGLSLSDLFAEVEG